MSKTANIQVTGKVMEALSNSNFKVELDNGVEILCFLSGKMRTNYIKVIPGDRVEIEMSPYDLTKGRIYRRLT
jgi:translation initiation factor IF-1